MNESKIRLIQMYFKISNKLTFTKIDILLIKVNKQIKTNRSLISESHKIHPIKILICLKVLILLTIIRIMRSKKLMLFKTII